METIDYVVERILPEIGSDQFLDLLCILVPIIIVLKEHGRDEAARALNLYKKYFADPILIMRKKALWTTTPLIRPLLILLKSCSSAHGEMYNDINDDIAWMLDGEEKFSDREDTAWRDFGFNLSLYVLMADCCLNLAKVIKDCDSEEISQQMDGLIQEGLRQSGLAEKKMKDEEGNVVVPMRAYMYHSKVFSELQSLLVPV